MTATRECKRCGQTHDRCTGHVAGRPCKLRPMRGQRVCGKHGGKAPQNIAAAKRRQEAEAARAAVVTLGLPREVDPGTALLEEVYRTAGYVAWLARKVEGLDEGSLTWGVTKTKIGGDDRGETSEAKPNVWYQLLVQERKHLVDVCTATLKAGIDERRVRLAEQTGDLLASAIEAILADLRLSAAQQKLVPTVVPRHLRAITAGGA